MADRHFLLGAFRLRSDPPGLFEGERRVPLDRRELAVLTLLAHACPNPVSKDELIAEGWPGVVVGDNALQQVVAGLRRALGDDAKQPTHIHTVPRVGYRLGAVKEQPIQPRTHRRQSLSIALVVQPFEVIGDSDLSRFADLAHDVLLETLANTTIRLAAASATAEQAPYRLNGRVRATSSNSAKISLTLTRRDDGEVDWSETVEQSQNARTFEQATALARKLEARSLFLDWRRRLRKRWNHDAVDAFINGMTEWLSWGVTDQPRPVVNHLEEAIQRDPDFPEAHKQLAIVNCHHAGGLVTYAQARRRAHILIRRAIALDQGVAYYGLAQVNWQLDLDYAAAHANLAGARIHGPDPLGYLEEQHAYACLLSGDLPAAIERMGASLQHRAGFDQPGNFLALARMELLRNHPRLAVDYMQRAIQGYGSAPPEFKLLLARSLQESGQQADARSVLAELITAEQLPCSATLPAALAMADRKEEAWQSVRSLETEFATGQRRLSEGAYTAMLESYLQLGAKDKALAWVHQGVENRMRWTVAAVHHDDRLQQFSEEPSYLASAARLTAIEALGSPTPSIDPEAWKAL